MDPISRDEWQKTAERLHGLIAASAAVAEPANAHQLYPKLCAAYVVARMFRGEGFWESRPEGVDSRALYELEAETEKTLAALAAKIPAEMHPATNFDIEKVLAHFKLAV